MLVEIPLDNLIILYRMASLGKLINGLVHNLNGPLQALSMDLEMAEYSLINKRGMDDNLAKNTGMRLKRMEEELENIKNSIKTTSIKANLDDDYQAQMTLSHFLQQELSFLKANLYFKNNVHTELQLEDDLPLTGNLPEEVPLALSLFLQIFIEEMERQEIKNLALKACSGDSGLEITFTTGGKNLSEEFIKLLSLKIPSSQPLRVETNNMATILILALFKLGGASVATHIEPPRSSINIKIPTRKNG